MHVFRPMRVMHVVVLVLSGFLVPADADSDGNEFPTEDTLAKGPVSASASRRAARVLGHSVCQLQVIAAYIHRGNAEAINRWLTKGGLSEMVESAKYFCQLGVLTYNLNFFGFELQIRNSTHGEDKRAVLVGNSEYHWSESESEHQSNWKLDAVHAACMETFRRDGDRIAEAVRKAWIKIGLEEEGEEEEIDSEDDRHILINRIHRAAGEGCSMARTCKLQMVEDRLEEAIFARDEMRRQKDEKFSPMPDDFRAKKVVLYDKDIDYYKILGVDQTVPAHDMNWNANLLLELYGTKLGREMAGVSESDGKRNTKLIKSALKLFKDPATRRQYDRDRDRLDITVRLGLEEWKGDKTPLDGQAMLLAFRDEIEELKHNLQEL